jgi:hypothetical protein
MLILWLVKIDRVRSVGFFWVLSFSYRRCSHHLKRIIRDAGRILKLETSCKKTSKLTGLASAVTGLHIPNSPFNMQRPPDVSSVAMACFFSLRINTEKIEGFGIS